MSFPLSQFTVPKFTLSDYDSARFDEKENIIPLDLEGVPISERPLVAQFITEFLDGTATVHEDYVDLSQENKLEETYTSWLLRKFPKVPRSSSEVPYTDDYIELEANPEDSPKSVFRGLPGSPVFGSNIRQKVDDLLQLWQENPRLSPALYCRYYHDRPSNCLKITSETGHFFIPVTVEVDYKQIAAAVALFERHELEVGGYYTLD